ncbi:MAG: 50S ribosomal protein L18 [Nitrososphaerales archaeon]
MAKQHYVHIFKRRRAGKTDYRKRRGLIMGRKPFLTVRISNKYIYGQVLSATAKGDLTLCASSSRDLAKDYGWKGSTKNLPSAYLAGYVLGKEARRNNIEEATVYTGTYRFIHGSRIAAFLGGAKDGGLKVAVDEQVIPDENRTKGSHISEYAKKLSTDAESYKRRFSKLLASGLKPEDYSAHFDSVKSSIDSSK